MEDLCLKTCCLSGTKEKGELFPKPSALHSPYLSI